MDCGATIASEDYLSITTYAPTLPENRDSFLRLLKNNDHSRVGRHRHIHDPAIQQESIGIRHSPKRSQHHQQGLLPLVADVSGLGHAPQHEPRVTGAREPWGARGRPPCTIVLLYRTPCTWVWTVTRVGGLNVQMS
jgi:hypothetical protein